MTRSRLFLSLTLLALAGCDATPVEAAEPRSQAPEGFWDHWGDGQAEIASYTLSQRRYGELRSGEAVLVTVTETFTAAQRVKSDGGHPDEFPVVKLNEVRDFQTGLYDYNALTSAFLPLDGRLSLGLPTKLSMSLQEWCGHAYEQIVVDEASWHRTLHSYFDGEADQDERGELPAGAVAADAMPLLVRGLVGELLQPGETREVPWLPSLLEARLRHRPSVFGQARISRSEATETVEVPAGSFEVWRWEAKPEGGSSTTWLVEDASPRRLVAWSRGEDEQATLLATRRSRYWQEAREGDERIRTELKLPPHTWPAP